MSSHGVFSIFSTTSAYVWDVIHLLIVKNIASWHLSWGYQCSHPSAYFLHTHARHLLSPYLRTPPTRHRVRERDRLFASINQHAAGSRSGNRLGSPPTSRPQRIREAIASTGDHLIHLIPLIHLPEGRAQLDASSRCRCACRSGRCAVESIRRPQPSRPPPPRAGPAPQHPLHLQRPFRTCTCTRHLHLHLYLRLHLHLHLRLRLRLRLLPRLQRRRKVVAEPEGSPSGANARRRRRRRPAPRSPPSRRARRARHAAAMHRRRPHRAVDVLERHPERGARAARLGRHVGVRRLPGRAWPRDHGRQLDQPRARAGAGRRASIHESRRGGGDGRFDRRREGEGDVLPVARSAHRPRPTEPAIDPRPPAATPAAACCNTPARVARTARRTPRRAPARTVRVHPGRRVRRQRRRWLRKSTTDAPHVDTAHAAAAAVASGGDACSHACRRLRAAPPPVAVATDGSPAAASSPLLPRRYQTDSTNRRPRVTGWTRCKFWNPLQKESRRPARGTTSRSASASWKANRLPS